MRPTLLLLLLSLSLALGTDSSPRRCMHDAIAAKHPRERPPVSPRSARAAAARATTWATMRIAADTTYIDGADAERCDSQGQIVVNEGVNYRCNASDVLTSAKAAFIKEAAAEAVFFLESFLKVRPVANYSITGGNCGSDWNLTVPAKYTTGTLQGTDYVMFVTARPIAEQYVLAFASACRYDALLRPVAGYLNIDPESVIVAPRGNWLFVDTVALLLHEMTHALGFNSDDFPNFIDGNGTTWPNVTKQFTRAGGTSTFMITPKVVAATKAHFNCSTAIGAPIEDQGGSGTAGSHWEMSVFMNELMVGIHYNIPIVSSITMALFEDSGWYTVQAGNLPSYSAPLVWGRSEGCQFLQQRCDVGWPSDGGYFCRVSSAGGCTADRYAVGFCNLAEYDGDLPTRYRYFADPRSGGAVDIADYCPHTQAYSDGSCRGGFIAVSDGEAKGNSSFCFTTTLNNAGAFQVNHRCYPTRCADSSTLLVSVRGSSTFSICTVGAQVSFPGYSGSIFCPPVAEICYGAPVDNTIPIFQSIQPESGPSGTQVVIVGKNLDVVTAVFIGGSECVSMTHVSGTIHCTASSSVVLNPNGKDSDITLVAPGISTTEQKAYKFEVSQSTYIIAGCVAGGLALLIILGCLIRCCVKSKAKKKKRVASYGAEMSHKR